MAIQDALDAAALESNKDSIMDKDIDVASSNGQTNVAAYSQELLNNRHSQIENTQSSQIHDPLQTNAIPTHEQNIEIDTDYSMPESPVLSKK